MKSRLLILFLYFLVFIVKIPAQSDTVVYYGIMDYGVLFESIELYPDSTFKQVLDYEAPYWYYYGLYELSGNELILTTYLHPISTISEKMTLSEMMVNMRDENVEPLSITKYKIRDNYMWKLDEEGHEIRTVKDEDLMIRQSWLNGQDHPLYYRINNTKKRR